MTAKIAINGFGRIGRNVLRCICQGNLDFDIVAVNDLTAAATPLDPPPAPSCCGLRACDRIRGAASFSFESIEA